MFFGKLLPKEGNFFELFNQHADRIVEAARAFEKLVSHYGDLQLRAKYNQEVDDAERLTLSTRGRYLLVAMMRQFFIGVNNLRDQARAALPPEELKMFYGEGVCTAPA